MNNAFSRGDSLRHLTHRISQACDPVKCVGTVRRDVTQGVARAGRLVGDKPLLCLGAAFLLGIVSGWWIKRT
jgi:hypothetical protein